MTGKLEFNEQRHEYRIGGKVVPSVTSVIKAILPTKYEFAGEWHMQRGTATHRACELFDNGVLDCESVDPEIEPRVRAWRKFREQMPMDMVANEKKLAHEGLRFAGTIDRVFSNKKTLIVCDLKNSVTPHVRLQLAAYSLLWTANGGKSINRAVAVELLETGAFKCHWIEKSDLRMHERQFVSMLSVYNFAQTYGLLKGKE